MELVDIRDLKSLAPSGRAGSTPAPGTSNLKLSAAPVPGLPFVPKASVSLSGTTDKFPVTLSVLRQLSPIYFPSTQGIISFLLKELWHISCSFV